MPVEGGNKAEVGVGEGGDRGGAAAVQKEVVAVSPPTQPMRDFTLSLASSCPKRKCTPTVRKKDSTSTPS